MSRATDRGTISHERLLATLSYDPITGHWADIKTGEPRGYVFFGNRGSNCLKGRKDSPRLRLPLKTDSGKSRNYLSSRLAYFYMTGEWPSEEMDHINRDTMDDRWVNLRASTRVQNKHNTGPCHYSKTGIKGVFPSHNGLFRASIMINRKRINMGSTFKTVEEAAVAYKNMELAYGSRD